MQPKDLITTPQPTAGPDPWMAFMRKGDFGSAWDHCDSVLATRAGMPCWHLPRHFQYVWDGTPLAGKTVLVRCYHGLGDTIQFIRYAPMVKALAKKLIVWAQPKLIPLLQTVEGIDELLPLHDGAPAVQYDVDVEIMELAHVFRTTADTIPCSIPYIHAEKLPRLSEKICVGLVWKGGDWDHQRSMEFREYYPLQHVPGVEFYILQPGAMEAGWKGEFGHYAGEFNLYDYAHWLNRMDLLISIDSMPVHLAGSLGIPVWNLLQASADWRWMEDVDHSPWYPGMRLFRQPKPGAWQQVVAQVTVQLERLVAAGI